MERKNGHDLEFYNITSAGNQERLVLGPALQDKTEQDLFFVLQLFYDSSLLNLKQLRLRFKEKGLVKCKRISLYFYIYLNVLVSKGWLCRSEKL